MKEEDKKIIGNKKHLYDETVIYDEANLPQELKEYINELKEYDKKKDWFSYDFKFDVLEMRAKVYLLNNVIKEYDYKKILAKYGWLYD